jgi:Xaa-Pro aminopeptidase
LINDIYPGLSEYNVQAFFEYFTVIIIIIYFLFDIDFEIFENVTQKKANCGLTHQAYRPIVGAGNHSAILHWQENSGLIGVYFGVFVFFLKKKLLILEIKFLLCVK